VKSEADRPILSQTKPIVEEQASYRSTEPGARAPSRRDQGLPAYLPSLILALIALGFARTLGFGFVNWDDGTHVLGNPAVVSTGGMRERWLTPSLGYAIPVTVASYRVEYLLAGATPWVYHATNLLLHLGVCGLVYRLGRRLGLGRPGASLALLFFGLHPVVVEPVSWISGRKDLLAALFGLSATLCYLGAAEAPARRWRATLLATLLFALAAFAKPSVLTLPLAWALLGPERAKARWWRVLPALLVAASAAVLSWVGESQVGAVHATASPWVWARELLFALGYHLGLALFVQPPLAKHIPAQMPPWFDPAVDLLPLGIGLLTWLWLRRLDDRARRAARSGLLFAIMAYLPSSGVVPLTRYLADSYVYLPLVGLAWFAGASWESLLPAIRPVWRWAGAGAIAASLLLASSTTATTWRGSVALWQTVWQRYPDSPEVCLNLGNAYFERAEIATALRIYERCSRQFGPGHFAKNRAIALFSLGRRAEAARLFERLAVDHPDDPVIHRYLGQLIDERGPAVLPSTTGEAR
jgi:tetratricopeptide (TPR) repeat protein